MAPTSRRGWPAHAIARAGIGRTFQNIRLFGAAQRDRKRRDQRPRSASPGRVARVLRRCDLLTSSALPTSPIGPRAALDYGAQRRLEIARALALRPRYLLLDEPGAGMNPTESNALLRDLAKLREETGIGLLVIDHDMSLIMRLCDRIVVLNRGQVIAEGSAAEIQTNPAVIEAYIGRKRAKRRTNHTVTRSSSVMNKTSIRRLARRFVEHPRGTAAFAETLVIGAAISKTGWNAPYDSPVMDGLAVAIDEINAAGGIAGKFTVEIETRDNRSDNAQNAIVTQELIDQGVNLMLVACDSSMVHAGAQIIVAAKIPAISTCSSSPTLPMTGNGYIFANAVTDNVQGAAQAEYAWGQGYKNAYLLRSPDIEYTQMPLYFAQAFKKLGGTIVGESLYALNQPDFSAEVTKIKGCQPQPDVIVTSAFEPDFPAFIRQLRGAGVNDSALSCGDGIDSPTTFGLGDVGRRRGLHLVRLRSAGQPDGGLPGQIQGEVRQGAGIDHGRARL